VVQQPHGFPYHLVQTPFISIKKEGQVSPIQL
jgi:hypothetical protein